MTRSRLALAVIAALVLGGWLFVRSEAGQLLLGRWSFVKKEKSSYSRLRRVCRRAYVPLTIFIAAILSVFFIANYNGYCITERRFLADREYFAAVIANYALGDVKYVYPSSHTPDLATKGIVVHRPATVDEFLRENPDCCRFGPERDGYRVTLTDRIFGYVFHVVVIEFVDAIPDVNGVLKPRRQHIQVGVSPCGHVIIK